MMGPFLVSGCATKPFGAPPAAYEQPRPPQATRKELAAVVHDGVELFLVNVGPCSGVEAVIMGTTAATMSAADVCSKQALIVPTRNKLVSGN